MKIGFWALLNSEVSWSNARIAREAAARGYDGVDLRVARMDGRASLGANVALDSTDAEIDGTRAAFAAENVEISSLNCYNDSPFAGDAAAWRAFEQDIARHADLAVALGTPRIRLVVEGPAGGLDWITYLHQIWASVGRTLDDRPGIDAVVENHPGRASARQLFQVAKEVGDPRIGVDFSPEHAFVMQEDILALTADYCPFIHRLSYADRKIVTEDLAAFDGRYYTVRFESCWNGDGDMPTARMFELLRAGGFDDYVTLKYEKSSDYGWHLPPAVEGLDHFPGFLKQFGIESTRV